VLAVPLAIRHCGTMRLLAASLGLALLAACGPAGREDRREVGPQASAVGERDDASSRRSVADHFSPPPPPPGPTWTRAGRPVDGRELNSVAGSDHCGWQSVVMMHLGWPLGTVAESSAEVRQFIRDPDGVIVGWGIRDKLRVAVDLPDDARDTGYRNDDLELWLVPSDPDAAYLRVADDVERWPRADPAVGCR
jgi:hypothetical protein